MKIKVQTRKLVAGCSKQCRVSIIYLRQGCSKHYFEVADKADVV
ncbi:hypothetical protein [Streptococcus pneumoniae]|nr:hypothetical protein [Streptococcus pneumoniae]